MVLTPERTPLIGYRPTKESRATRMDAKTSEASPQTNKRVRLSVLLAAEEQCAYANGADRTLKLRFDNSTEADCTDGVLWTSPVRAYEPNAFGLHDTLGDVWEWVEDCWHDDYDDAPRDGSAWTRSGDCGRRVLRGGSWCGDPRILRSAHRNRNDAETRNYVIGFRVARTPSRATLTPTWSPAPPTRTRWRRWSTAATRRAARW